jgi:hypothetical protein
MFLQEFFVLTKGDQVIEMKNDIGKLWVEFAFVKVFIYFFQVGKKGIFF